MAFLQMHIALETATTRLERDARLGVAARDGQTLGRGLARSIDTQSARCQSIPNSMRHLRDRPQCNVGLDELAAVAAIGKFRLIRLFRERTGLPPHALHAAVQLGRLYAPYDRARFDDTNYSEHRAANGCACMWCPAHERPSAVLVVGGVESACFHWRLPEGYVGDPLGSGLVPETPPNTVQANRWSVAVVVSDANCTENGLYAWSISGRPVANIRTGLCQYLLELPREGKYRVRLDATVGRKRLSETQQIAVVGRLIVSIGDSIASGEGVPDVAGAGVLWQDRQCHRSARGAPALAAQILQRRDPQIPVTFIHLACSGATIEKGLIGSYRRISRRGEPPLPPQVDILNSLESRRPADAVLISIGANDVHFSDVVRACIPLLHRSFKHPFRRPPNCFSAPASFEGHDYGTMKEGIADLVGKLRGRYEALHAAIASIPSRSVFLMEYYDPTRSADGGTCASILGIDRATLIEARKQVLDPLNEIGKSIALEYKWHYVSGVEQLFAHHGYCVKGPGGWVVSTGKALGGEHSPAGTLHPNAEGHRQLATLIANALEPQLNASTPVPTKTVNVVRQPLPAVAAGPRSVDIPEGAWLSFGYVVLLLLAAAAAFMFGSRVFLAIGSLSVSLLALSAAFAVLAIEASSPSSTRVVFAIGSVIAAAAGPTMLWNAIRDSRAGRDLRLGRPQSERRVALEPAVENAEEPPAPPQEE